MTLKLFCRARPGDDDACSDLAKCLRPDGIARSDENRVNEVLTARFRARRRRAGGARRRRRRSGRRHRATRRSWIARKSGSRPGRRATDRSRSDAGRVGRDRDKPRRRVGLRRRSLPALSISSTTAKSAASALSDICTRTVASAGSSVKATCRSACQGIEVICTDASPIATQGCGPGNNPPRANTAATINGTAEARILKRNMIRYSLDPSPIRRGLWLAECKQNSLPPG